MIEQQARVVTVSEGSARIRTENRAGCGSCSARGGCGTGLVAQLFPSRGRELLELPIDHLRRKPLPGERVIIGIDEAYLFRNTWRVYALPLSGLLLGALGGDLLGRSLPALGTTELGAIAGSLLGLGMAFAWLGARSRRLAADLSRHVRILRVDTSATVVAVRDLGLHV